jgi:dihydrodipicolinate synthase/N-acetylneuraminate lyase
MRAVVELQNLDLARRIYYRQILPVVDVMVRNNNPTGTIKAGVCARGVEVGVPRRPGSMVGQTDRTHLESLMSDIAQAEVQIDAELGV